ncbi:hypothetical protein [Brevibacillus porteri]|uniref:hypothetical protein n=1 Tax=Brevibacillus porteri TaxID=2126350 RepID=UPI003D24F8EF
MNLTKVLIVGGYGTVGSQIAKIHLTALGAAIFAQPIIRQSENSTVTPGILFPEDFGHFDMTADDILQFYRSEGVQIVIHDETKKSRTV